MASSVPNNPIYVHTLILLYIQHSSGRGGVGNISTSRSRSRGPNSLHRDSTGTTITPLLHANAPPLLHSTGRGGAGNIITGDGVSAEVHDEEERERVGRDSQPRM